jgi:hypothetical protein
MTDAEQLVILDGVYRHRHVTQTATRIGHIRLMVRRGWINANGHLIKPYGCTLTEAGARRYRELLNGAAVTHQVEDAP